MPTEGVCTWLCWQVKMYWCDYKFWMQCYVVLKGTIRHRPVHTNSELLMCIDVCQICLNCFKLHIFQAIHWIETLQMLMFLCAVAHWHCKLKSFRLSMVFISFLLWFWANTIYKLTLYTSFFSPTAIALGSSAIVKVSGQNCVQALYGSLGQICLCFKFKERWHPTQPRQLRAADTKTNTKHDSHTGHWGAPALKSTFWIHVLWVWSKEERVGIAR